MLFFLLFQVEKSSAQEQLPLSKNGNIKSITAIECSELKDILKSEIYKNPTWKKLIQNKKMAIGIVDLSDPNKPKYAGLNDQYMMYAASLPKIAVLYAVMDAIEKGEIKETPAIKKDLRLMISKSNNAAATRMIDLVGFDRIEATLQNAEPKLYDESCGGGLWCGKRYGSGGGKSPDPMKGLSHAATTLQVCNFYYLLTYGELINKKRSAEMLSYLKDPELTHKFVNTLQIIAPNATIYRKSGSWKSYHSDSVLVWGPNRKYVLVALIDNSGGEQIIRSLVKPLEAVIEKSKNLSCSN